MTSFWWGQEPEVRIAAAQVLLRLLAHPLAAPAAHLRGIADRARAADASRETFLTARRVQQGLRESEHVFSGKDDLGTEALKGEVHFYGGV